MNKKLIFIVGSPRSGTTLLLSYLCGLKNTKILYETQLLIHDPEYRTYEEHIESLACYFDNFCKEEIVIEKTPEHVHYLDVIEQLRKVCKRDIYVIYVTRPPVPTVLSILKAKEVLEVEDILGACEKYEESLVSIYHNLITNTQVGYKYKIKKPWKNSSGYMMSRETSDGKVIAMSFTYEDVLVPYSFHVTYRGLTEDSYFTLYNLLVNELHLDLSDSDIRGLLVNRVSNLTKVLPQVLEEKHHSNLFKEVDVVNKERANYARNLPSQDVADIKYISCYFTNLLGKYSSLEEKPGVTNLIKKSSIYDLVTNKQIRKVEDNPLVTIVVPLYNKEKYIVDTLNSLLNQTYQNIYVMVIDDGSTDRSLEIVDKYIESLDESSRCKISVLTQDHFGVSEARNRGLIFASDIISFCDADDVWDSTLVEKSVATFKKYPYVDCVYSRVLLLKDGEVTKNHSKICNGDVYEDSLEYNFLTCGSNIFVKASVIEEHKIRFNVSYNGCEDWDFLIQLAKVATFKCTKEYLVTYRQVPNSLSSNRTNELEGSKRVLESYLSNKDKKFSRIFTRLYLYYFSIKNLKWRHIKDLDYSFIMRVVVSKLKSFVKLHLP